MIGEQSATQDRFGIAVSGGADSMALLLLAAGAFAGRVEAATVDHGLRGESATEAAWVAAYCAQRHIPHVILSLGQPLSGSLQAAARNARYALLEQWRADRDIDWLMTAHHADDQLETMIMRLNRSSGVGGLAAIRARQGRVLRPLLGVRHNALVELVAAADIQAIDDPSNRNPRFDRARLRQQLAGQTLIDVAAAAASASHLADADAALDWMTARLADKRIVIDNATIAVDAHDLPIELTRRLVLHILATLTAGQAPPRGYSLDRALDLLAGGQMAMLGNIRIAPESRQCWRFAAMPARRGAGA